MTRERRAQTERRRPWRVALRALALGVMAMVGLTSSAAHAQQVVIDQPVRAGELILFPDVNDATVFYYVSDKPRLAVDANGRPKFSFLRFVENVRSGADQPDAREGAGGGIVHAVVALSVTPQQLTDARRELQRVRPGGRIQGPVVFKSGRFGLISSVRDPQGGLLDPAQAPSCWRSSSLRGVPLSAVRKTGTSNLA